MSIDNESPEGMAIQRIQNTMCSTVRVDGMDLVERIEGRISADDLHILLQAISAKAPATGHDYAGGASTVGGTLEKISPPPATHQPDETRLRQRIKLAVQQHKESHMLETCGGGISLGVVDRLTQQWEMEAETLTAEIMQIIRQPMRESGEPYLHNRADGVDGHYCIARKSPRGDFYEYYEAGKWVSATSLIFHLGKTNEIEDQAGSK